ncbi:MAG: PQQ-dependent sugar dehydrogenase [Henriciella sp.]
MRGVNLLALSTLALGLTACGDGGESGTNVPLNVGNQIPGFTSSAAINIQENTIGIVYTAATSDPDGDAVTVSISGGPDAGLLTINANSGELSFNIALDFENPADANGDNVYELTLQARDSRGATANLDLEITVTDQVDQVISTRVGTGFQQPLGLVAFPDGSGRVLVVEKAGRVRLLDPATGLIDSVDFLDVAASVSTNGERGLLGLALSPDFQTDGLIFVHLTNLAGDSELRSYAVFGSTPDQIDPATEDVLLRYAQPETNHNAGWIGFDANGYLIIPTGDGGGSGDPNDLAQDPQSYLGKVLRIDVSGDDFPSDPLRDYAIPAGNTFSTAADGLPEIFAVGLRNPFQSSFDPISGDLIIGDVGQGAIEEVNRLPMDDSAINFGWAVREGTAFFKGADRADLTSPVAEYAHGTGDREGRSITGGVVYQGPVEAFQDHYVFGDFISGNIWAVPVADLMLGQTLASAVFTILTPDLTPSVGSLSNISAFGTDESGNLYIVSLGGDIFRMDAAP